jgi:hypothetical protein
MKLTFNPKQCFSVPEALYSILNTELLKITPPEEDITAITFYFRDPEYSADDGGFHPVEIRIIQPTSNNNQWSFEYITDFSFQGLPYPELAKDIDVCFITKTIYTGYVGALNEKAGDELFKLFIENFVSYAEIGIFEVEISFN